jgi:hypothetical protein
MSSEVLEEKIDLDGDGKVSNKEINVAETRFKNRRRMAWLAMGAMVSFTAILLTPYIDNERIKVLDGVFCAFYLAMASIVGAYMGFTTWATKQ